MGWLDDAWDTAVAKPVQQTVQAVQNHPGAAIGLGVGGIAGGGIGAGIDLLNSKGSKSPPSAPGLDPGLSQTADAQRQQAMQFRSDLPANETRAFQNLAQGVAGQTTNQLRNVNTNNSSRGLLYSGINQGQRQQVRNNSANTLTQGRSGINAGYETAANQLDAAAVGTGVAIQQSQQAIQNQIYAQALQNMANQNAAFGSLVGAGGVAAGLALA